MQNIYIALFACSNGYGHIKRLLLLANALSKYGANPILFAPESSALSLAKKEGIKNIEIINFNSNTTKENWLDNSATEWTKFAPNLSEFDIVISDNLIEILNIRPDAWLSGSFFWHTVLTNFPLEIKQESLSLLKKYRPKMISSKLFTSDYLKKYTDLYEVGLYSSRMLNIIPTHKTDALIACGAGLNIGFEIEKFVNNIAKNEKSHFKRVWVEPEFLPVNPPSWMLPATFNDEMYQHILVSIIRPGVGTISNSLSAGSRIFPFYENDNLEMKFNAVRIFNAGFADDTSLIKNAWNQAILYSLDKNKQKEHYQNLGQLNFDGANEAAKIILNKS